MMWRPTKVFLLIKISMIMILYISLLCQPVWANAASEGGADAQRYRAVGDSTYPPLVFINNRGQQDGYDIDLLALLEGQTVSRFKIDLMEWYEAEQEMATGKADILIGVVKTPQGEKKWDFTEPYLETRTVIFVAKNNFVIKGAEDLANRRVGVQREDVIESSLAGNSAWEPVQYTNQKAALIALAEGRVDAVVGDYFTGMYWTNQYNWQDAIKVVGPPLSVNNYCLGVKKGNLELVFALNNAIVRAKTTGQLQQLQDKWFGENYFSSVSIYNRRFLEILKWFLGAAIFIILVGVLFVYSLRRKVDIATIRLREANYQLANAYEVTIRAFFSALEKRESGTARHSFIVNSIALEIGREMNLSETELLYLNWGTLLHDIGKLAISDDILLKQGQLTDAEYEKIKLHPQIGYEILQDAEYLKEAAQVALYHQERYDGKGYPYGLIGNDIPLLARICTVADAFEAMIADRPYRKGRHWQEAVAEVVKHSGSQFDPAVVAIFINLDHRKFLDTSKE